MFKFLKKTTKKVVQTAFEMWKNRRIQKAKLTVAAKLDSAVDGTTKGVRFGLVGLIVVLGCAAGSCVLLPTAYCLQLMAATLTGAENEALMRALTVGSQALFAVGIIMVVVLLLVIVVTFIWSKSKNRRVKSKINEALRD